jgi:hypothetical protein
VSPEELAKPLDLGRRELIIRDEVGQDTLVRAVEETIDQLLEGASAGLLALDQRMVTMSAALLYVSDIFLLFKAAQDGENRGVCQIVDYSLADLRGGRWPPIPKHLHHVRFPIVQHNVHDTSRQGQLRV